MLDRLLPCHEPNTWCALCEVPLGSQIESGLVSIILQLRWYLGLENSSRPVPPRSAVLGSRHNSAAQFASLHHHLMFNQTRPWESLSPLRFQEL